MLDEFKARLVPLQRDWAVLPCSLAILKGSRCSLVTNLVNSSGGDVEVNPLPELSHMKQFRSAKKDLRKLQAGTKDVFNRNNN